MLLPHKDKLEKLYENNKIPEDDRVRLGKMLKIYQRYRSGINRINFDSGFEKFCKLINRYSLILNYYFIYCSKNDFLYRQKGQLKLESSLLEEFMLDLIRKSLPPNIKDDFHIGPTRSFSRMFFKASLKYYGYGGLMEVKSKDQDVAVAKKLYIRTSFGEDFNNYEQQETFLSFFCIECKTNLDKTMFQESIGTAMELKASIPNAKYFIVCEWLDMTPINTKLTPIDEVIILRGKRLPQSIRENFGNRAGREDYKQSYKKFLLENPIKPERLSRIREHLLSAINVTPVLETEEVLRRGYF